MRIGEDLWKDKRSYLVNDTNSPSHFALAVWQDLVLVKFFFTIMMLTSQTILDWYFNLCKSK
jgi:hypothetical protein